jgi:hypothetical protein
MYISTLHTLCVTLYTHFMYTNNKLTLSGAAFETGLLTSLVYLCESAFIFCYITEHVVTKLPEMSHTQLIS